MNEMDIKIKKNHFSPTNEIHSIFNYNRISKSSKMFI